MVNYDTQINVVYRFPKLPKPTPKLSTKAQMRLQWMDFIDKHNSIPLCARHFHYPYRTVKYWRDRYERFDLTSLEDKSKRPNNVRKPMITKENRKLVIKVAKYTLPASGKVTIQKYLLREYGLKIGQNSIQRIINEIRVKKKKRKVVIVRKNRKHMYTVPKEVMKKPGGLVYLDVKHLKFGQEKWYQFTAIDHATRLLRVRLYKKINSASTIKFLQSIRKDLPFNNIQYLGTDNGSEFLGDFDHYLKAENINHVFSSPSSPKQNPFVERVIRTIIDQQYSIYGLEDNPQLQQQALDDFCEKYNNIRPHHSLNLLTPREMYDKLSSVQ